MGATGKIGKRTKKFQKKHLDGELRRRKVAKIKKQRATVDARRRARNARDSEGTSGWFGMCVRGSWGRTGDDDARWGRVGRAEASRGVERATATRSENEARKECDVVSLVISK